MAILVFASGSAQAQKRYVPLPLSQGLTVSSEKRILPGTYRLPNPAKAVVTITGSDFAVDFKGSKLIGGRNGKGIGVLIENAKNVTILNADVSGYLWGVALENCVGVKLLNCKTSRNSDLKPGTEIDESGTQPEDQWGGGILIRDSGNCLVRKCVSQYQWDGIDVIRSSKNAIEDSDFSYSGNWGVHFWNSQNNVFKNNRAIWCTTGSGKIFQALTGWQTYDSQAVGIDHNSNENLIEGNDLRYGGDGIFIRANEGPIEPGTVVPPKNGSHRNILRNNDCSFSPNNAIEVDLVDDTVIEGNNCSNSNYGMWLGYSRRCIVRNNLCINDSKHAVEIENGQDDLFENNIFGFEKDRPEGQLVYLRQNGRDKTPSGGYKFRNNLFYGAGSGILLKNTKAEVRNNALVTQSKTPTIVKTDSLSQTSESGNRIASALPESVTVNDVVATPGKPVTLTIPELDFGDLPALVLASTRDASALRVLKQERHSVTFAFPEEGWDEATPSSLDLKICDGKRWVSLAHPTALNWREGHPRFTGISALQLKIGEVLDVRGVGLKGGKYLLNGKPAEVLSQNPEGAKIKMPEELLVPTRYFLSYEKQEGEEVSLVGPLTVSVAVPAEQLPHLLSATFEPKSLKVGERLKVTMTLRNNLPVPARLLTKPAPEYAYSESQSANELGFKEEEGVLHLRITSDNTGKNNPGSWPYLFGFDREKLAPGETITVVGYIKMEFAGKREFRAGLVAGGFRFIDDNAFRTKIEVLK